MVVIPAKAKAGIQWRKDEIKCLYSYGLITNVSNIRPARKMPD
jgi:hypothetical protein